MKYSLLILVLLFFSIILWRYTTLPKSKVVEISQSQIIGGIVPHHLYVQDIIADFFRHLPEDEIDNLFLLGPNHLEIGDENIVRSPTFSDQSISSLLPFIANTYSHAVLATFLFKHATSLQECQKLASELATIPGRNLLLVSLDFSHYLTKEQADVNDLVTLQAIRSRDYATILKMSSDYLDSPASLVTALLYFDLKGNNNLNILAHDNSGSRGNPYAPTTSYYSMIFDIAQSPLATPIESPSSSELVTILAVGDVMLGRSVNQNIVESGDSSWPFRYVKDTLKQADITFINLESPLVKNCPVTESGMIFCGASSNVVGLVSSGVDVASVANNHATNYGIQGLAETVATLDANGIKVVGQGEPAVVSRRGHQYAFLSYNDVGRYPGISSADPATISAAINSAKQLAEVVLVSFHWGSEYQNTPNARQVQLAHAAIDAGADVVIGAHPHWVQTKEIYQGKPIYYSLGNFVFDQEWSVETKKGLAVRLTYQGLDLLKTEELPVFIQNYGQPTWSTITN